MNTNSFDKKDNYSTADAVYWEVAHPQLYRMNAFRVIELPSDARPRDVSKRLQLMQMQAKFGNGSHHKRGLLRLDPAPDEGAIRAAKQRLSDPRQRLVDEFFWFWPNRAGESAKDETLTALASGQVKTAHTLWTKAEKESRPNFVAKHNLAVLTHLMALDLEVAGQDKALTAQERQQRDFAWQHAFKRWQVLAADHDFWTYLVHRVRELDDPGLTSELVSRFRKELPLVLLSINAQMAVTAAEQRNVDETKRQIKILRGSGFSKEVIYEAVRRAVQPIRQRVAALCKTAEGEVDASPEMGDASMMRLLQHTQLPIRILKSLLPEDHSTRVGACDEVALTALRCQIAFGNKTENWKRSTELIQLVLPLAASESVRARIEENRRIVEQNWQLDVCWFCGLKKGQDRLAVEHQMHGNVQTHWVPGGQQMTWTTLTVKVPRCETCNAAHARVATGAGLGCLLGLAVGIVGAVLCAANGAVGFGICVAVVAGFIGLCVGGSIADGERPQKVKPVTAAEEHPAVKRKFAEGWRNGAKPPGVQ
jgi:hypothetical protein